MDRSGLVRPLPRHLWSRVLLSAVVTLTALTAHGYQHSWHTLVISGTPPGSVSVGQGYAFAPTASGSRISNLVFAIANLPVWATFSRSTGKLTGTPGAASIGTYANIVIAVSDGRRTATLPSFTVLVTAAASTAAPAPAALPPVISGTPPTSVIAGSGYAFQPAASDPAGKPLSFSVQNKPAWAGFSIASGQLYGTPSTLQTGTYANIVISASDGTAASALSPFSITVNPTVTTGTAMLDLTPPSQNSDGSPLTDLAGMRVYYGTSASGLTQVLDLPGTVATTYTLSDLASGTWYFAATAYTSGGQESSPSATVSKSIP